MPKTAGKQKITALYERLSSGFSFLGRISKAENQNNIFIIADRILTGKECCYILYHGGLLMWEDGAMEISYNRLWKLLIDKGMTKTEMRKRSGISTSVLAKMGKNETVSVETLAKIATVLDCGLDDILEIKNDIIAGR